MQTPSTMLINRELAIARIARSWRKREKDVQPYGSYTEAAQHFVDQTILIALDHVINVECNEAVQDPTGVTVKLSDFSDGC